MENRKSVTIRSFLLKLSFHNHKDRYTAKSCWLGHSFPKFRLDRLMITHRMDICYIKAQNRPSLPSDFQIDMVHEAWFDLRPLSINGIRKLIDWKHESWFFFSFCRLSFTARKGGGARRLNVWILLQLTMTINRVSMHFIRKIRKSNNYKTTSLSSKNSRIYAATNSLVTFMEVSTHENQRLLHLQEGSMVYGCTNWYHHGILLLNNNTKC